MSKRKKGVSASEKKDLLLSIFHESKEFYQLKDLEKLAVKDKGLREQAVKEILQSLIDEGLVESEKIGSSLYFWSFPAKKRKLKQNELEQLKSKVKEAECQLEELRKRYETAKEGEAESSKDADIFEKYNTLKAKESKMIAELQNSKKIDKSSLKRKRKALPALHTAVNRWTDNIFSIKSWCKKRFNIEESLLDKQFQIPPDLDYLE